MTAKLVCTSRIDRVVVYARGAMITRRVTAPGQAPSDAVDLVVPGLSPLAEPGSFRADTLGGRSVLGLRPRLVFPQVSGAGGELREKIKDLERASARLEARQAELLARREGLLGLDPRPALNGRARKADPAARFGDALAVDALASDLARTLDADLEKLAAELESAARALAAARVEAEQASTRARALPGNPTWEVTVHLAAGGPVQELELSYPVAAARWWPAYSARIAAGAASAELSLEAFVAHASFEDWTGVRIGLCTADMASDTRLPELPSLRLGRAQPPRKSGFRPPPEGLEVLFSGYDLAMRGGPAPADGLFALPQGLAVGSQSEVEEEPEESGESDEYEKELAAPMEDLAAAPPMAEMAKKSDFAPSKSRSAAPMAPPMPSAAPSAQAMPMAPGAPPRGGMAANRPSPKGAVSGRRREAMEEGGGGAFGSVAPVAEPEPEIDADTWLDYDALALPANDSSRRGRLTRASTADRRSLLSETASRIESAAPPGAPLDPLRARGEFDHRYDAQGPVDVPSNGLPHRITLAAAAAPIRPRFRTVPREGAEVYREAVLTNPFPSPLLGGPVDVFMDGALLSTTPVSPVGRGGPLTLGLGVEERLRVARNARASEEAKGVFSGTAAIEHQVTVDVTSALGLDVELEVLERLPVSDEKDVKVTALAAKPAGEAYDQADRGAPIRGGLRFKLPVPAGGKAALSFGYLVELPSKMEIVGGNRRE